jgi:uncharacterized protein (TIGR03435 family)
MRPNPSRDRERYTIIPAKFPIAVEVGMMCQRRFGLLLALAGVAAAQSTVPPPGLPEARVSFEVASIKLHPGTITMSSDPAVRGRRVTGTASTLLDLITTAYGVKYEQVSGGPGWVDSDHYDIDAKAEGEGTLTKEQARQMLQTLLAERFQLKIHRETKEVPVYALVVGRNGPKLKETSADAPGNNFVRGSGAGLHMEATRGTMEQLARQLSNTAGRPVVDKTGLTGYYAYTLDWIPASRTPEPDSDTPSMLTAIQEQLGLKLERARGPIEMLLVDHAEKPSEN